MGAITKGRLVAGLAVVVLGLASVLLMPQETTAGNECRTRCRDEYRACREACGRDKACREACREQARACREFCKRGLFKPCTDDTDCGEGLLCEGGQCLKGPDEPCTTDEECASGSCNDDPFGPDECD